MACMFNSHVQTVNGLPVVPAKGSNCDCGKMVSNIDAVTSQQIWQYSPTGRLVGR